MAEVTDKIRRLISTTELLRNGPGHVSVWAGSDDKLYTNISGVKKQIITASDEVSEVNGPGSSTDLAIALWDGTTGTLLKNSLVTIGATGKILNVDGTAAAPSLAFASDTDTGLYRIGANNIGVGVNGAKVVDISTTGLGVTGGLTASTGVVIGGSSELIHVASQVLGVRTSMRPSGYTNTWDFGAPTETWKTGYFSDLQVGTNGVMFGGVSQYSQLKALTTAATFRFTNGATTAGFVLDGSTDSTMKVFARDGSSAATVAASQFQTTTALVALGGGAAPTLGTIGGSGPASAAQNSWVLMKDSTGASFWVPVWK